MTAPRLSQFVGLEVWLKLENRQRTGSFKERGALLKLLCLKEAGAPGVVAASTGNHAQAVAFHGRRLGIPVTIVMPSATSAIKVREAQKFGADVVLQDGPLADCEARARSIAAEGNLAFVHPYDDETVVAGQGTIGLEMLGAVPDLDVLIVPIGGGGLIAGVAVAATSINPHVTIIGVQSAHQPHFKRAIQGLEPVAGMPTIADGITVQKVSRFTLEIVRRYVADVVLVSEEAIESAIYLLLEEEKLVSEGAGAAGVAALMVHAERFSGRRVGIVLSGGNIDPSLLANVITRARLSAGMVACIRVMIADRPGSLSAVSALIAEAGANVVDLAHRRLFSDVSSRDAALDFMLELRERGDATFIADRLNDAGFPTAVLHPQSSL